MPAVRDEQQRPLDAAVGRVGVIPDLTLTVDGPLAETVDVDVLTAPEPPGRLFLERHGEGRGLPVLNVFTEADGAGQRDVHVLQKAQVQRLADGVVLVENHGTAIVALMKSGEDLPRVVLARRARRLDEACLGSGRRRRNGLVGGEGRGHDVRTLRHVAGVCSNAEEGGGSEKERHHDAWTREKKTIVCHGHGPLCPLQLLRTSHLNICNDADRRALRSDPPYPNMSSTKDEGLSPGELQPKSRYMTLGEKQSRPCAWERHGVILQRPDRPTLSFLPMEAFRSLYPPQASSSSIPRRTQDAVSVRLASRLLHAAEPPSGPTSAEQGT